MLAQENIDQDIAAAARVDWLLSDNQGSIRDIVDHDGVPVEHYKFDSFGRILEGDTSLTRYLYTAREFDATSGLQYNRNRWYDSGTGRWLSEDPDGFRAGDPNLYRYVFNSPTNGTDPDGLAVWPWDSNANWNIRDTLSLWTGGIVASQAQSEANQRVWQEFLATHDVKIGAAPNPTMLVEGVVDLLHEMGYGEQVDSVINFIDRPPPAGFKVGMAPPLYGGRRHSNSLSTRGAHDVYVIREDGSRRLLHFGESGRGYLSRFAEHQRAFDKLGIDIEIKLLRTVDGKAAARQVEARYIDAYRRMYGRRPPYNRSNH